MILAIAALTVAVGSGYLFIGCHRSTRQQLGPRGWAVLGILCAVVSAVSLVVWWPLSPRDRLVSAIVAAVLGRLAAPRIPLGSRHRS